MLSDDGRRTQIADILEIITPVIWPIGLHSWKDRRVRIDLEEKLKNRQVDPPRENEDYFKIALELHSKLLHWNLKYHATLATWIKRAMLANVAYSAESSIAISNIYELRRDIKEEEDGIRPPLFCVLNHTSTLLTLGALDVASAMYGLRLDGIVSWCLSIPNVINDACYLNELHSLVCKRPPTRFPPITNDSVWSRRETAI